ncbi:Sec-independent protein translocase subunit TatB [Pseudomonas sp. CFBP 8770]|uniref:Sec-independent protein translocase protein TatB n=1 Tax=unclassified Pseudomonas TaxID=196821 RepID=UPI001782430E|nr:MULTISPECIES: Sec-independent protein translocase protein TatB [unclassified Pseudomonas]MBD8473900.1 Sec-independent protein translocase subunit TatB [Pseudomonas sp. CFBP 8773]MBD8647029.1 Sec-independent protein translocase subunit TatB [Pseudomonas sp. CFBP 8770]
MFGISFSELMLVGLIALLVLGPERLPGAARTAGLWIGRLKRSFNAIKTEVEREIGADEIRRQLHNEHVLSLEEQARKILDPQRATRPSEPPAPLADPIPPGAQAQPVLDRDAVSAEVTPTTVPPAVQTPAVVDRDTSGAQAVAIPVSSNEPTQPPRAP